jgi:hypothetical protein
MEERYFCRFYYHHCLNDLKVGQLINQQVNRKEKTSSRNGVIFACVGFVGITK